MDKTVLNAARLIFMGVIFALTACASEHGWFEGEWVIDTKMTNTVAEAKANHGYTRAVEDALYDVDGVTFLISAEAVSLVMDGQAGGISHAFEKKAKPLSLKVSIDNGVDSVLEHLTFIKSNNHIIFTRTFGKAKPFVELYLKRKSS